MDIGYCIVYVFNKVIKKLPYWPMHFVFQVICVLDVLVSMQGLRRDGGTAPFSCQFPLGCCRLWGVHAPPPETHRATHV